MQKGIILPDEKIEREMDISAKEILRSRKDIAKIVRECYTKAKKKIENILSNFFS